MSWLAKNFWKLLAIIAFAVAAYDQHQRSLVQREAEHRWIYGFGIRRPQPAFATYLEPETSEGLREIRWDHKPKQIVQENVSYTTSTVMTISAVTGAWATCTTHPPMNIVTY